MLIKVHTRATGTQQHIHTVAACMYAAAFETVGIQNELLSLWVFIYS